MQADIIIEMGLAPTTILVVKDQQNAREKWEYLKKRFLKSSSMWKMMKLMRICTWTWDETKHDEKEAWQEFKQMLEEYKEMNGGDRLGIDDLGILQYLCGLGDKYTTF